MTTRAFTLIELLATIAIIALLIGLLMPALGRARASGQQLVCSSNARQLQMANTSFALDNNERYAPGAKDFVANLSRWHGTRTNTSSAFTPNGSPLYDYLGESDGTSQAVRECPTFERVITVNEAGGNQTAQFERAAGGYGYNNAFVGTVRTRVGPASEQKWVVTSTLTGSAEHRFRRPCETVAFSDAAFFGHLAAGGLIEYSFAEPRFQPAYGLTARADPSMHFRHSDKANIAHLDGHVTANKMTYSQPSLIYRETPESEDLGWHGTEDSNAKYDYR